MVKGLGEGAFAPPKALLDREGRPIRLCQYWDSEGKKWTKDEKSLFPGEHAISATAIDWEDDGDADLLIGARNGTIFLRLNEGSAAGN